MLPIDKEIVERLFNTGLVRLAVRDRDLRPGCEHAGAHRLLPCAQQVRRRQSFGPLAGPRVLADGRPRGAPGHRRPRLGVRPARRHEHRVRQPRLLPQRPERARAQPLQPQLLGDPEPLPPGRKQRSHRLGALLRALQPAGRRRRPATSGRKRAKRRKKKGRPGRRERGGGRGRGARTIESRLQMLRRARTTSRARDAEPQGRRSAPTSTATRCPSPRPTRAAGSVALRPRAGRHAVRQHRLRVPAGRCQRPSPRARSRASSGPSSRTWRRGPRARSALRARAGHASAGLRHRRTGAALGGGRIAGAGPRSHHPRRRRPGARAAHVDPAPAPDVARPAQGRSRACRSCARPRTGSTATWWTPDASSSSSESLPAGPPTPPRRPVR